MKKWQLIILLIFILAFTANAPTAMAETKMSHGDEVGHVEVEPVKISLADSATMDMLKTDWLNMTDESHFQETKPKLSNIFWLFLSILAVVACFALFLFGTGVFKRFSLNLKLYTSYGFFVGIAVILGLGGYLYLERVNGAAHQETAFLDLDMMASEIQVLQNEFSLHGIENKSYGEKKVEEIKMLLVEYSEDIAELRALGHLNSKQVNGIAGMEGKITAYKKAFDTVVEAYHEIEESKEFLDELGEKMDKALEGMIHHHEDELAKLESRGADMSAISKQTILLSHLNEALISSLKLAHNEVEFLLDKHAGRVDSMNENLGDLKGYLKVLESKLTLKEEKEQLREVEKEVEKYQASLINVIKDEAIIKKLSSETTRYLDTIEELGAGLSHDAELVADSMQKEGDMALIALILISIVSGTLLSFFISRGISRPINKIIEGMSEGAGQVASASNQVSISSQSMAEGSSEQAASIEETSSSMEEMSSMTRQNAENSSHADNLMKDANQVVESANETMDKLTVSMGEISKASDETSKIIKKIDEIAFQTNLLALNAAVEAARAGEAGAGFAVVADEVRNLAMRAADAAKDTARLIEDTVKKVNSGSELVSTTNEAFDKVADSTSTVGGLLVEISEASKEQSSGIEQVNNAITEMDKVVQGNAANSEESAAAAEELNAQAEQLRDFVAELEGLVTGKKKVQSLERNQSLNSRAHLEHKAIAKGKPKKLSHKKNEIRPDQVIPFDDDEESFQDF